MVLGFDSAQFFDIVVPFFWTGAGHLPKIPQRPFISEIGLKIDPSATCPRTVVGGVEWHLPAVTFSSSLFNPSVLGGEIEDVEAGVCLDIDNTACA